MKRLARAPLIPLISVCLLVAALMAALAVNPSHEKRDVSQERLDRATTPLSPQLSLTQTFLSRQDGLKAAQLLVARYDRQLPTEARIALTLERLDRPDASPVRIETAVAPLQHNQRLRFDWAPIHDSAGSPFRITLTSDGDHGIGFWATDHEAYSDGSLTEPGQSYDGDLHLVTYYDHRLSTALGELLRTLLAQAIRIPALVALLLVPGGLLSVLLLRASGAPAGGDSCRSVSADETAPDAPHGEKQVSGTPARMPLLRLRAWWRAPTAWLPGQPLGLALRVALVVSLSLAFWPLLLLWCAVVGLALGPTSVWVLTGAMVLASGVALRPTRLTNMLKAGSAFFLAPSIALALVMLLAVATRVLQAEGLHVPPWVDSVHHTVVTAAVAEQGQIPSSLEPYAQVGSFHYHVGFHANAAALTWLARLSPPDAVLLFGQVLNALSALMVYALARWWTGRRWAGVGAALVVATLSYMPAYYLTWGRYTQLAGLVLLPGAMILTQRLWEAPRLDLRRLLAAGLMVGGLLVTHYRVAVFYMLFGVVFGVLAWWRSWRRREGLVELPKRTLLLLLTVLVLALPLIVRFATRVFPRVNSLYGGWSALEGVDTSFPVSLLKAGWTETLLYIAAAGLVWAAIRRQSAILALAVWSAVCFLPANLHVFGLPDTWFLHNLSVVISFWLPVSVCIGWLFGDLLGLAEAAPAAWPARALTPDRAARRLAGSVQAIEWLVLTVVVLLGGWGLWRNANIINTVTVLVSREDREAIEWVRHSTPEDAFFLINSGRWQGELRAGSDAGWWLQLLTGRRVSLPCVLYAQGEPEYVEAINALSQAVEEAPSVDDQALIQRLERAGITHVFSGSRGGRLLPKDLDPSPNYRLIHAVGPARVYEFTPGGGS